MTKSKKARQSKQGWLSADKTVYLPEGTRWQFAYDGRRFEGTISKGQFMSSFRIKNVYANSPSGIMTRLLDPSGISKLRLNGWIYIEVQKAGQKRWSLLATLRNGAVKRPAKGLKTIHTNTSRFSQSRVSPRA